MNEALMVLAQSDWDGHHDMGDGWWIVVMVGMLAFWAAVAVAGVWAVRHWSATQPGGSPPASEDPLQILDRRLAEGEISVEEYTQRRDMLKGQRPDG